jgi:hypothetical protein
LCHGALLTSLLAMEEKKVYYLPSNLETLQKLSLCNKKKIALITKKILGAT